MLEAGVQRITQGFLEGIATDSFIAFDTALMRMPVLKQIGEFNNQLRNGNDFEFWWRAGLQNLQVGFSQGIGLIRYKYPGSLSSSETATRIQFLQTLDACAEASRQAGKPETIELLRPAYRNAWQNIITASAKEGDLKGAFVAFRKSLKYGFQLGSIRLLLRAFLMRN